MKYLQNKTVGRRHYRRDVLYTYICLLQFMYIYLHEKCENGSAGPTTDDGSRVGGTRSSGTRGRHYGRATVPRLSDPPEMTAAAEAVTLVSAVERGPRMPPA